MSELACILSFERDLDIEAASYCFSGGQNQWLDFEEAVPLLAERDEVHLILSSTAIRGFFIKLPKTSMRLAEQALPWKLEPLVASPISELHISHELLEKSSHEMIFGLCALDKSLMDNFIQSLKELNVSPSKISFLPEHIESPSAFSDAMLWKNEEGFGVLPNSIAANSLAEQPQELDQKQVFEAAENEQPFVNLLPKYLLPQELNLWLRQPIKSVSLVLLAALLPVLGISIANYWSASSYQERNIQLEQDISAYLVARFPQLEEANLSADEILRMAERAPEESRYYLEFLDPLSSTLDLQFGDVQTQSLNFDLDTQMIQGQFLAPNMERVTQLRNELLNSGLAASLQSATSTSEGVSVGLNMELRDE